MSPPRISIRAENLHVSYGAHTALEIGHLDAEGSIIALVGHNGAGKSTLIKSMLGLRPLQGELVVSETAREQGAPQTRMLSPERDMAFCPENGAVFSDIPVESYIRLWCRIKHGDGLYYRRQGASIIEQLEVTPLLKRMGRELSKGQRRRVQAAIGFLTNPRLFLFDEPFDGLDVKRSSELSEIITSKTQSTGFVISSHRMDVIERLADQVVVLRAGAAVACDTPERVACQLAGRTVQINGLSSPASILAALRKQIPHAVLSQRGEQVLLTAKSPSYEQLLEWLAAQGEKGAMLLETPPSLVDAIDYFLRGG